MSTPSQPGPPGATPAVSLRGSSTQHYEHAGPPMWLLVVAAVTLVFSIYLLAQRSFGSSMLGLAVTVLVLAIISLYRYLVIRGEANPEFIVLPWQTRTATALLVANFIVSIGHAYFIALEVGKQWG